MRLLILAFTVAATISANTVTSDRVTVDVGSAELIHDVFGPGSVMWRIPVIVSARLTNNGPNPVLLNGVGGGSALFPPTQIMQDGIIDAGAWVEGAMYAADLAAYLNEGPDLTDQQIVDGVAGSGFGIYRMDGTPLENGWLIPPVGYANRPAVAVHRSSPVGPADDPLGAPEPATFALSALGLAGTGWGVLRRRK